MQVFETKPKQWGNSLGITIPKDIVKNEKISEEESVTVFILKKKKTQSLEKIFGTFKCDKPTQEIMDEIDEGYD